MTKKTKTKGKQVTTRGISRGEAKALKESINILLYIITGIVVFMIISFAIAITTILSNNIRDKNLYLKYDSLYESYLEKNSNLENLIIEQQIQINDLENVLKNLKVNFPWLKITDF